VGWHGFQSIASPLADKNWQVMLFDSGSAGQNSSCTAFLISFLKVTKHPDSTVVVVLIGFTSSS
jgi:hypothetical protein